MDLLAQQGRRGKHRQQKPKAFQHARGQQKRNARRRRPQCTASREKDQAQQHQLPGAVAISHQPDWQSQEHASQLHQGQQEAGLYQGQSQGRLQHRNRHWHLSNVQRTSHTNKHHQGSRTTRTQYGATVRHQRTSTGGVGLCAASMPDGKTEVPISRSCSRMAKRSVMPAM